MKVVIRQATLQQKQAIFNFLNQAYKSRAQYKYPERWYWEYINNPFRPSKDLPVWIALKDGEIVGQSCGMYVPLKIGNRIYRAAWSVDTIVLPEYRGQKIGFLLQKAQHDYYDIFMSLLMSEGNRKIKLSLGAKPVDAVTQLEKLVKVDRDFILQSISKKFAKQGYFKEKSLTICRLIPSKILAAMMNLFIRLRDLLIIKEEKISDIIIEEVNSFGEEANELWEELSPYFPVMVQRDAVYLNWKFMTQPHIEYRSFIARKHGRVCGYVILRKCLPPERNVGIIADVLARPDDQETLYALVRFGVTHLKEQRVNAILAASTINEYQECFSKLGFRKVFARVPLVYFKESIAESDITMQPGGWFLGRGDHDWDQFPLF